MVYACLCRHGGVWRGGGEGSVCMCVYIHKGKSGRVGQVMVQSRACRCRGRLSVRTALHFLKYTATSVVADNLN